MSGLQFFMNSIDYGLIDVMMPQVQLVPRDSYLTIFLAAELDRLRNRETILDALNLSWDGARPLDVRSRLGW